MGQGVFHTLSRSTIKLFITIAIFISLIAPAALSFNLEIPKAFPYFPAVSPSFVKIHMDFFITYFF